VRLKGGDPFVFGRGGEEALALKAAGVAFEIVPGVSSALGAPAAASIPVTHRGLSGAVLVTTGHDPERFANLVAGLRPGAATLVVLMATRERAEIASALLDAGWAEKMPAAIVWNASLPHQSVWSGTLRELPSAPEADGPGTLVIGDVVAVGDALTVVTPAGLTTFAEATAVKKSGPPYAQFATEAVAVRSSPSSGGRRSPDTGRSVPEVCHG
jgi:siroheme synthase